MNQLYVPPMPMQFFFLEIPGAWMMNQLYVPPMPMLMMFVAPFTMMYADTRKEGVESTSDKPEFLQKVLEMQMGLRQAEDIAEDAAEKLAEHGELEKALAAAAKAEGSIAAVADSSSKEETSPGGTTKKSVKEEVQSQYDKLKAA